MLLEWRENELVGAQVVLPQGDVVSPPSKARHHPLADWAALDDYQPPDMASDEIIDAVARRLEANAGRMYTVAEAYTLWQRMYYLHGFKATAEDLLREPERSAQLRDLVLQVLLRRLKRLGELPELDGILFCDGWGTQRRLLISPRLWREFFKPAYAAMFGVVRRSGKHVWLHCFGMIEQIIPDLIEVGVDVLHPQPSCMDRRRLRELTFGRVCILGDVDRQRALPRGTPEEVRNEVRERFETLGPGGGFIFCTAHNIQADTPTENIVALFEAYRTLGRYRR